MKQHYILAMIVVILGLLWVGSGLLQTTVVTEGFQSQIINLNMCPRWAPQVQTARGNTDCCEGSLQDGKCNAKTFCTLSPSHDGVDTCLEAWRKYFAEQSKKQCPSSMTNYFENVREEAGIKGCSASTVKEDGSGPTNTSAPKCRIYPTEQENREEFDSCFIEKERLKIKCPKFEDYRSEVVKTSMFWWGRYKFGSFVCAYTNNIGQRNSCNDEKSLLAMWDRQNPNWRTDAGESSRRFLQLKEISCNTFLEREAEKRRLEELRRRAEEERRRREELINRFRNFFRSRNQGWEDMIRRIREAQQRAIEEQQRAREAEQRRVRELEERLKNCPAR